MAKGSHPGPEVVVLPSGRRLDLRGPRSKSLLDDEGLAYCRSNGVALAYDPVQHGLVPASCADDIAGDLEQAWLGRATPTAVDSPGTPARLAELERRCKFRRWADTDLHTFVALLDDPAVWRYLPDPFPAPLTPEIAADLIELSNTSSHHDVMAVEVEGSVVGQVRLLLDEGRPEARGGEISYWLGKRYWGRGIASDAVELFTHRCFHKYPNLETIVAQVHQDNLPSARALTKSGYRARGPSDDAVRTLYGISRREVLETNPPQ